MAASVDFNQIPKHYDVRVFIDNKDHEVIFPAEMGRPFIAEGRTFTPYRIMCENLGAQVNWDEGLRKVTANGNKSVVELFIGNSNYKVNGEDRTMDVEPFILAAEGRTYIPARYLTEGLGYKIDFAQDGKVMFICSFTKGQSEAEMKAVLNEIVEENKAIEVPAPEGLKVIHDDKLEEMYHLFDSKGYDVRLPHWSNVNNDYGCIQLYGSKYDDNKDLLYKDACEQTEAWMGKEAADWLAKILSACDKADVGNQAKIIGNKSVGVVLQQNGELFIDFDSSTL